MTTPFRAGAYTGAFRDQHGGTLAADVDGTAAAAAAADWKHATASAARVQAAALHLHHSVVRDALAAGLDWSSTRTSWAGCTRPWPSTPKARTRTTKTSDAQANRVPCT